MGRSPSPRLAGAIVGVGLSAVSWITNLAHSTTGVVSTFPDVVTLLAVPVALYLFLRRRSRGGPVTMAALRRSGWQVVNTAAVLYAIFMACLSGFAFQEWAPSLLAFVFVGSLVVTAGVGYLSTEIWVRMMQGR